MEKVIKSIALAGVMTLAGCGGGGGGDVEDNDRNLPDSRPVAGVSGVAFDGLIIDGDVKIYDFTGGVRGALLASGKTDGQGLYSLSLSTSDKPVLVQIDGGFYVEEATGVQIPVDRSQGHKLLAVEYYESGKAIDVSATFFTTVATGLTECYINNGMSAPSAIEKAYGEVDSWAGINVRRTVPLSVDDSANVTPYLTDRHRYGFVSAAISELTKVVGVATGNGPHNDFSSIAFISKAYDDSKDCLLDGMSNGSPVIFGNLVVNANTYRDLLALRMLQFVRGSRNETGLSFDDMLQFASALNLYAGELFNYVQAPDITESKPTVSQLIPIEGAVISKSYTASAVVSDDYGLEDVTYYIDGQFAASAGNPENPVRLIDTLNYINGPHTITVVVTNVMGNTSSITHNIFINNGSVTFSVPAGEIEATGVVSSTTGVCNLRFTVSDTTTAGVEYVKLDDSYVLLNDDIAGGSKTVYFSQSAGNRTACTRHSIEAVDRIGNQYTQAISVKTRRSLLTAREERAWCTMYLGSNC